MFSDPFTAVMALILLAFIGTLAVFLRIWRELDSVRASIRELKDNMQFYAIDAAQQNRDLAVALRDLRVSAGVTERPGNGAGETCLGEILEKGLPNIMGEPEQTPEQTPGQTPEPRTAFAASSHEEDEDLIRRLGDGLGTDVTRG